MTKPVQVVLAWIREMTPRWVTLILILWMGVISLLYGNSIQEQQCLSRVESRRDIRGAFIGVYDYIDPDGTKPNVVALRASLDATYPPLYASDC